MSSPDEEGKPVAAPLDAEREQLRKAGYTDVEVSQILIARALAGSQQPAGATGQGVMSNVLSSILGVASHARMLIPTFRTDVATVFDGAATASARAGATASLAVKAVVIVVLGFAAWQEWQQHIIAAPETAKQQTINVTEQAKNAAERERAIAEKAAAEARVAREINEAQLRKTKAEECSARMKAILDTQPPAKALPAGAALQEECSDYIIQTPARPVDDAQVKMVDMLHFNRWLASNCHWAMPPNFDVADRFMADNSPAEYAAGRAAAQQSITQYITVTKDLDSQMACVVIRSQFDQFTQKLDTLLRERLGGQTPPRPSPPAALPAPPPINPDCGKPLCV